MFVCLRASNYSTVLAIFFDELFKPTSRGNWFQPHGIGGDGYLQ